ncbi:DNRLRE domain-containing protein [Peribacillus sp. JNUCC 23]
MKSKIVFRKWLICLIVFTLTIAYLPLSNLSVKAAAANAQHSDEGRKTKNNEKEEILDLRTENSKTFINENGTYTSEIAQEAIHFKNEENEWEEIDNTLIESSDKQSYENKSNEFSVNFKKSFNKEKNNVSLQDGNKTIEIGLEPINEDNKESKLRSMLPVSSTKGIVNAESITYPNVFDDIDVRYSIGSDRIKEDIIYKEKPKNGFPNKFTYKMNLDGLDAIKENDIIYLIDPNTKEKLYYVDAPYMYDSFIPDGFKVAEGFVSTPEEAISYDIKLDIEKVNGQMLLQVIPNKDWLESEDRIYPITIDPTIVRLQSKPYAIDTNIRSATPTTTGGNDSELGMGKSSGNTIRSLIKFDLSSIPTASTILSSSLNLWYSSTNNNAPIDIGMYKVTKDWAENEASWTYAKRLPSNALWTYAGGDYVTSNKLATVTGIGAPTNIDNDMKKWNIPIHIVQEWLTYPAINYGVLLKSENEALGYYKKFASSEQVIAAKYKPLLTVTYKTNARLGLEDYWTYDTHPLVGGTSYTNLTTSNNVIQYEDFTVLGRANSGLTFTRTYNSKNLEKSALGYGWTFTGNEKIYLNIRNTANILNYQDEDGTDHEFTYDGPTATYYAPAGRYETIKKTGTDTYTMHDSYGNQTIFKILESSSDTDVKVAYIQTQIDRNNNKVNYEYNNKNQLKYIKTDLGKELNKFIELKYNSKDLLTEVNYDNDKAITFTYTSNDYLEYVDVLKNKSGESSRTTFKYKDQLISTIIDPKLRKTDFTYNNGDLVKVQEPQTDSEIDSPDRPGTSYTMSRAEKRATVTDAEDNTTTYYSNDNYVVEEMVDPSGEIEEARLDTNYNVLFRYKYDENGNKVINESNKYDSLGNLLETIDAEGNKNSYTYTTFSNISSETDSNGKITNYQYDTKGNLKKIEINDNNATNNKLTTTYEYDTFGDILSIINPDNSKSEFINNYAGGIKTEQLTDAHGNIAITKNDLNGNLKESIDGKGNKSSYAYNLKDELELVTDAKGNQTKYLYDKSGNLNSVENAKNFKTEFGFNGKNLLEFEKNALGQKREYYYDGNGNLLDRLLPNGSKITNQYDDSQRLQAVLINGQVKWKFDYSDARTDIYEGDAILKSIEYYDNGLVKSVKEGVDYTNYKYLGDNYNSEIEYNVSGEWITLKFIPDDVYRTKEIQKNGTTLAKFSYTSDGLLEATNYNNNPIDNNKNSSIVREYNKTRLNKEVLKSNPTSIFKNFTYRYDANNQIEKVMTESGEIIYDYDKLNQLTSEKLEDGTSITYDYDSVGNRITKSIVSNGTTKTNVYKYNSANQLTKVGNQEYTYDLNGNLRTDGKHTYTFDDLNQLREIKEGSKIIASYDYDEQGRRNYKNDSNGKTYYYYEGNNVVYEQDAHFNIIKEYTYDDNNIPLTMTYQGKNYYYLTNYRGDVLGLVDSNGNIVAEYRYDAWGNILSQSGSMAEINPYRYAGYRYDEDTKLYYLIARYYNPDNGVFLSLDPVRGELSNPITLNGYNYANNNPVMNVDPDGELSIPVTLKKLLRSFIKLIFNDFIANTVTNALLIIAGGGIGAWTARKLAMKGFTNLNRNVGRKTIIGFITGGMTGYGVGKWNSKIVSVIQYWAYKTTNYEAKFDKTFVGRSIDNALRKTRDYLLRRI